MVIRKVEPGIVSRLEIAVKAIKRCSGWTREAKPFDSARTVGKTKQTLSKNAPAFVAALGEWFAGAQRDLPWRREPGVYKTVVSEFMLQQTQVATVLPFFARWLARFPNFEALALADEAVVLKHWEGLGYYSRARNLHKLAKSYVCAESKPVTAAEWLTFPGIGPYTSAAIASICYNQTVSVIDGNVVRILSRLLADATPLKGSAEAQKRFAQTADALVKVATIPGLHNQAMMELGATVCTKANPHCLLCPVREFCAGYASGQPTDFPQIVRRPTTKRTIARMVLLDDGKLLLHQRPKTAKRLPEVFEIPEFWSGLAPEDNGTLLATKRRGISNEQITEHLFRVRPTKRLLQLLPSQPELHWVPIGDIDALTLSGPHRKWLQELLPALV